MKIFHITLRITPVVLALVLIQTGTSAAYDLGWMAIQHRVEESRDSLNRLVFEIYDDGDCVDNASVVKGVVLRPPKPNGDLDPNGIPVKLKTLKFTPLFDYYGSRFDPTNSAWEYSTPRQLSDFNADIEDPLVLGTYRLEVTMDDGTTLIGEIDFDFLLDLPIISSCTFQIHTDSAGNLYWTWDIPEQLLTLAETYDLQYRAGVAAMDNEQMVALYWPNVPVEMGFSFTPSLRFQELVNRSDEIRFSFQIRSSNNNARAYSNRIIVKDLSSPISITPGNGCLKGDLDSDGDVDGDDLSIFSENFGTMP